MVNTYHPVGCQVSLAKEMIYEKLASGMEKDGNKRMDAIFVFGDRIAQDRDGKLYTGTSFSQEIFDRYLEHFDHLTLMMRKDPVDPADESAFERLNPLTDNRIDVVFLPDIVASMGEFLNPRLRRDIQRMLEK